jgi:hypothetical protein
MTSKKSGLITAADARKNGANKMEDTRELFEIIFFFVIKQRTMQQFPDFLLIKIIAFFMMMNESLMNSRSYWHLDDDFKFSCWILSCSKNGLLGTFGRNFLEKENNCSYKISFPRSIIFSFDFPN